MKLAKFTEKNGWVVRPVIDGPEAVVSAQIALLEAQGYKLVSEAQKPATSPYVIWSASYEDAESVVTESYYATPVSIKLDRGKLISAVQAAGMLDQAVALFSDNTEAQKWWADSMHYVEGSPMAVAFQEAFGLTLDQIHAFVEASRA